MNKIAFFHMNQLGDLLFSLPVLHAARKQWPGAKIFCVASPAYLPIIEMSGLANALVPRHNKTILNDIQIIADLGREKIDTGIFFSESPRSMLTGFLASIKKRVGFSTASLSFLITDKAERIGVPSLANNKRLGETAGITNIPEDYSGLLKVPAIASEKAEAWLEARSIRPGRFVVIAPGASAKRADKSWHEGKWREIIGKIAISGFVPVLTGTREQAGLLERLSRGIRGAVVYDPDRGIMGLAALMSTTKLFLGIDSGAMHLAACVGKKAVALFGQTDPSQVGPMPLDRHVVIKKNNMSEITVEEVWQKVSIELS